MKPNLTKLPRATWSMPWHGRKPTGPLPNVSRTMVINYVAKVPPHPDHIKHFYQCSRDEIQLKPTKRNFRQNWLNYFLRKKIREIWIIGFSKVFLSAQNFTHNEFDQNPCLAVESYKSSLYFLFVQHYYSILPMNCGRPQWVPSLVINRGIVGWWTQNSWSFKTRKY